MVFDRTLLIFMKKDEINCKVFGCTIVHIHVSVSYLNVERYKVLVI